MSSASFAFGAIGLALVGGIFAFGFGVFENSPASTWKSMKQAGCDGDVAAFSARIDRTRVAAHAAARDGVAADSPLALAATRLATVALSGFDDQVKRGSRGEVCGWAFVDSAGDYVRFVTVSGESLVARFQNYDGRWVMVELEDQR